MLGFSASALCERARCSRRPRPAMPRRWTAVGAVDADVSLWQLLTNDLGGGVVTLRDVAVTLAFDPDGRLMTRLPAPPEEPAGPMPLVRIESGTFTLRRDGRPDEMFHNIRLELRTDGEKQTLTGTIDDPIWGQWTVSGGREVRGRAVHADPQDGEGGPRHDAAVAAGPVRAAERPGARSNARATRPAR